MSFIWSYTKNNVAYAEVRSTERREKGETPKSKPMYLGKVIDIEKGIFQNRKLGIFKYDLDSGYDTAGVKDQYTRQRLKEEKAILDFGSSYMLHEYSKQIGFLDLFRDTLPKYSDSLMAMIFYYIEMSESNSEAIRWFRGSIANLLFPEARLQSQHISELLSKLGDDAVVRDFFSEYLKKYISPNNKTGVIVDSAGSPNAIHFPITAIGNQNGEISSDVKLLFAIDAKSGMPFFFRYSAGNIVDINILKHTIYELEKFGIDIKYSLLDAGYCSEENFKAMYDSGVNFLTRLPNNRKIFNEAFKTYKEEALSDLHRYVYHDGIVGIKRILASLYGNKGYVYLCVDFNKRNNEIKKFTIDALDDKLPRKEWSSSTDKMGFFALASSVKIHPGKLLPIYYQRETLEQLFDISKNKDHVSPLDTHDENTYRGHIMLSFMAVILYLKLNKRFAGHKRLNAKNALIEMKNLKCKVYDDRALIKKITKDMREICKIVDIKIPEKIFSPINRSVGGKKTGNSP